MELSVGDIVCVVDEPFKESPAAWVDEMDGACGHEVEITHTRLVNEGKSNQWTLCLCKPTDPSLGLRAFNWNFCSDCFVPIIPETEIIPADESSVKDLFGLG